MMWIWDVGLWWIKSFTWFMINHAPWEESLGTMRYGKIWDEFWLGVEAGWKQLQFILFFCMLFHFFSIHVFNYKSQLTELFAYRLLVQLLNDIIVYLTIKWEIEKQIFHIKTAVATLQLFIKTCICCEFLHE